LCGVASYYSEGLVAVKLGDKWGFINTNSDIIIPFKYDIARVFSQGLAPVKSAGKWYYINKEGQSYITIIHALTEMPVMLVMGLQQDFYSIESSEFKETL